MTSIVKLRKHDVRENGRRVRQACQLPTCRLDQASMVFNNKSRMLLKAPAANPDPAAPSPLIACEKCRDSLHTDPVQNSAAPPKLRNGGQMRSQDVPIT